MSNQDNWLEMSYYKYKNAQNLFERLAMEEADVFDIDNRYIEDWDDEIEAKSNNK